MKESEEQKAVEDAIQYGLTKFIGEEPVSDTMRKTLISNMVESLRTLNVISDIVAPLPEVEVRLEGTRAIFTLLDPKTKEPIDLATYMGRALENFYE